MLAKNPADEMRIGAISPREAPTPSHGIHDTCPNCGSPDRTEEPFVDENGTLTSLLTVLCSGCGYRLGDLPSLPLSPEAEDAEKSLEILPSREPEE
jgi:hypothetical protein